jgi:hypothetical protein
MSRAARTWIMFGASACVVAIAPACAQVQPESAALASHRRR